jgi:cytochrome b pre-mRNA-processing protein 3
MLIEPLLRRFAGAGIWRPRLACGAAGLNMPGASRGASLAASELSAKDSMLSYLFRSLTAEPARGAELFAAVTGEARRPHWYVEGQVPDTLDGRFAVLATIAALVIARLEQDGEQGNALSVALTERFIEVMEAEHRELGLGDPKLGRTVRKLVGSLARRTDLWRSAVSGGWTEATRESLYKSDISPGALEHSARELRELWTRLERVDPTRLAEGRLQ